MSDSEHQRLDIAALRAKLAVRRGPDYWRSLDELAQTPAFVEMLKQEFPPFATAAAAAIDRRRFLQIAAASMALAGLDACGREVNQRQLLSYVEQPPGIVPGRSRYYATATGRDGFGYGVMLRHAMGRPLKVEGNPDHPASLGATDAIGQATILGLYDPYRAQSITQDGEITSNEALLQMLTENIAALRAKRGAGFRLLTATVTSPTLGAQIAALQQAFPLMQWHPWEPLDRDAVREGTRLAFGRDLDTILDVSKADIILGIESDFLAAEPGHLRYAHDFAARRRAAEVRAGMSRLYAVESTPTLFGAKADHRLMMKPDELRAALRFIAGKIGTGPAEWGQQQLKDGDVLSALIGDLSSHRGRCLVHAGREQPADVHALAHAINHALGAFGATVRAIEPVATRPASQDSSLAELVSEMQAGKVDTLLILGVNLAYAAPADLDVAGALKNVANTVYLGEYADETAALCRWHIPAAHEYEAWSDIRAYDGTITIQQPQIRPLYDGRSAHEVLAILLGDTAPQGYDILRARWREVSGASDFETFWTASLRRGLVDNSAAPPLQVEPKSDFVAALPQPPAPSPGLTLLFRADLGLWDGRYAENGWLQEMSRPFTRLTWDNAAEIAPATAERLKLATGDRVDITLAGRKVNAPVWVLPGQAPDCVTIRLGYGRSRAGPVGTYVGFNGYSLRGSREAWNPSGATLTKTGTGYAFAIEQHDALMEGEDLVRKTELATFLSNPQSIAYKPDKASLYPGYSYDGIAWAMSISLNSCIGCQACVIACQAENNIPVVGKEEVERGRIMHWLRIDRYYQGPLDAPETLFQPVPCMHCENAPCEVVCPVQATVHDSEGLNVMIYNRCVGTRFCSNNCPYKVRRFNWFDYTDNDRRPRESWNPDVTVRNRGVMEKCTYCIQRTRQAMIDADKENRTVRDGEVVTACQQACPTNAIVFGNKNDAESAVSKRKATPLDYPMLDKLNTRPRTTYDMAVRNPNPRIKSS